MAAKAHPETKIPFKSWLFTIMLSVTEDWLAPSGYPCSFYTVMQATCGIGFPFGHKAYMSYALSSLSFGNSHVSDLSTVTAVLVGHLLPDFRQLELLTLFHFPFPGL